ncbi:MAG TPA: hypothetical protein VJN64_01455 [Terriglobales bacterium]|nr:hypothetical protein [Terriglobales bacterium]
MPQLCEDSLVVYSGLRYFAIFIVVLCIAESFWIRHEIGQVQELQALLNKNQPLFTVETHPLLTSSACAWAVDTHILSEGKKGKKAYISAAIDTRSFDEHGKMTKCNFAELETSKGSGSLSCDGKLTLSHLTASQFAAGIASAAHDAIKAQEDQRKSETVCGELGPWITSKDGKKVIGRTYNIPCNWQPAGPPDDSQHPVFQSLNASPDLPHGRDRRNVR